MPNAPTVANADQRPPPSPITRASAASNQRRARAGQQSNGQAASETRWLRASSASQGDHESTGSASPTGDDVKGTALPDISRPGNSLAARVQAGSSGPSKPQRPVPVRPSPRQRPLQRTSPQGSKSVATPQARPAGEERGVLAAQTPKMRTRSSAEQEPLRPRDSVGSFHSQASYYAALRRSRDARSSGSRKSDAVRAPSGAH